MAEWNTVLTENEYYDFQDVHSRIHTRISNQQLFSCIDFQIYQNDISVNVNSELKIQLHLVMSRHALFYDMERKTNYYQSKAAKNVRDGNLR